ncbi:hypothetical protein SAMN05444398_1088 [Roseovarius pacificus]|uniref:Uncharacterized protein n=2 Tax=Roseovarius pacificus TaxID=337701 RepID=A0A1M7EZH8_9RHOB|nr:hypothetical protein [Roseovarius pacificus]GGO58637.1 hypothetical protein GCM10011315_28670 [Roseovarius pacificus]SHL96898.1 hypothetical protein SAMN05444398_1088 [Roseovarius pacificus]
MLICPPINTYDRLKSKLQKAADPIYREYDEWQVYEARKRLAPLHYCVPCLGHVVFYKNMRVRKMRLDSNVKPRPRTNPPTFTCDLDVLGSRSVRGKLGPLLEHISEAEAEARATRGNCELAHLSDSALEQLWESLDNVCRRFTRDETMSLQLLNAVAALELHTRAEESAHARLKRLAAYEAFAEDNDAAMRAEREQAKKWFDNRRVHGYTVHMSYQHAFLDHEDQVVLAYRDRKF